MQRKKEKSGKCRETYKEEDVKKFDYICRESILLYSNPAIRNNPYFPNSGTYFARKKATMLPFNVFAETHLQ